jgi:hypothetical protein
VLPWLITMTGWPALTARFAGPTARVVVDPVTVASATTGALALAVALLWRSRGTAGRGSGPGHRPAPSAASRSGSYVSESELTQ